MSCQVVILIIIDQEIAKSLTGWESPVVADIDNDGIADIIVVSSDPADPGVRIFTDDAWPDARSMWNQFNYRITNVEVNGIIPPVEPYHWLLYNTCRAQLSSNERIPILRNRLLLFVAFHILVILSLWLSFFRESG